MRALGLEVFQKSDYLGSTLEEFEATTIEQQVNCIKHSEENIFAVELYKKLGFEVTGREKYGLKLPNGKYLVDLAMTLRP